MPDPSNQHPSRLDGHKPPVQAPASTSALLVGQSYRWKSRFHRGYETGGSAVFGRALAIGCQIPFILCRNVVQPKKSGSLVCTLGLLRREATGRSLPSGPEAAPLPTPHRPSRRTR
jgi:hypothetical protein